ncbi:MAG: PilZ domain-containing protein [Vicinamibacterales bacterium]
MRFEVVGPFWGTLDVGAPTRVHDLTEVGALIEADRPLAVESLRSVVLEIDGERTSTAAQVRHVRALDEQHRRYLVGVEFIAAPPAFREAVSRLLMYRALPAELL